MASYAKYEYFVNEIWTQILNGWTKGPVKTRFLIGLTVTAIWQAMTFEHDNKHHIALSLCSENGHQMTKLATGCDHKYLNVNN